MMSDSKIIWVGKYKGTRIEDLPSDYLKWLIENWRDEEIVEAAEYEYESRSDDGSHWWED